MERKRDYYGNMLALLALSLVMQNSTASDAYWWSRWAPSKETLTGIACAVPLAIYAQRFLAQRAQKAQLPLYSHFIPGALGTAVGTFARSDEGWGQALVQSLWHNSPSLAIAAMLWGSDYFRPTDQQPKQDDQVQNDLKSMFRKYTTQLAGLEDDFENALKQSNISKDQPFILKELLESFKGQYDTVVSLYDHLVKNKKEYAGNDEFKQLVILTPAENLYAHYLSYIYVYSVKEPRGKSFAQLSFDERKARIMNLSESYALLFIQQLEEARFKISEATKNFLGYFLNDLLAEVKSGNVTLEKAPFLMLDMGTIIKVYESQLDKQRLEDKITPQVRLTGTSQEKEYAITNEKDRLQGLMNEYQRKINNFIEQLFSEQQDRLVDLKYNDLLSLYASLQESIGWLRSQGASNLPENNLLLLEPHDYIYAAVSAMVIKAFLTSKSLLQKGRTLNKDEDENIQTIDQLMSNPQISTQVNARLAKVKPLNNSIELGKTKKYGNKRSAAIIDLMNELIMQESEMQE